MNFFDKDNTFPIRLRSFFDEITENKTIRSEGSWSFEVENAGDSIVTLIDIGGKKWILDSAFPTLKFVGHPGIIRDDIIQVEFGDGERPLLKVKYDRFVKKGDDVKYPGQ